MKLHAQQRINPVPNYPPNSPQKKLKHTRKSNKSPSNYNLCDTVPCGVILKIPINMCGVVARIREVIPH